MDNDSGTAVLAWRPQRSGRRHDWPAVDRGMPVVVRIPPLESRAEQAPAPPGAQRSTSPSSAITARLDEDVAPPVTRECSAVASEGLPGPHCRISPQEHALRRLRHEVEPAAGQSFRNMAVLILVLAVAASLTVWITHGARTREEVIGEAHTSTRHSPAEDYPFEDWEALPLDVNSPGASPGTWAAESPPIQQYRNSLAPDVDTWPPGGTDDRIPVAHLLGIEQVPIRK